MTKPKKTGAIDLVKTCYRVLEDKKAEAISVLDVGAQSSITDFLILATATSEPHLRALRVELEKALDGTGTRLVGIEMAQESGWVVIDAFDVMIHLFLGPVREHYSLERLWQDAAVVAPDKLRERKSPPHREKRAVKGSPKRTAARRSPPRGA